MAKLLVIVDGSWCTGGEAHEKALHAKHRVPISDRASRLLQPANDVTLKFRDRLGALILDTFARLCIMDGSGRAFLQSEKLAEDAEKRPMVGLLLFVHLEQVDEVLRATVHFVPKVDLEALHRDRPELRLSMHDVPPMGCTEIEPSALRDGMDVNSVYEVLLDFIQRQDPGLFAVHTDSFLKAPHIVVPLMSHLASLSAEENLKFPVQLKRLADQFRAILEMSQSPIKLHFIERNHLETWAAAQGKQYAFVDGGVAKIAGIPGSEPTALRVGIYAVRPGDTSLKSREMWALQSFVVGDILDKETGVAMDDEQQMDLRRLAEAARYTLEPLTALRFVEAHQGVESVFLHGPLVNQFVMYDEGEPHFIPFLHKDFLSAVGIEEEAVQSRVKDIPPKNGKVMWRQFMAVYGYIMSRIFESDVPFLGVVERGAGRWLAEAVLNGAVEAKIVNQAYKDKVMKLLKRYGISDDFLFGCVLKEGEYITPTCIPKNNPRRARDLWQKVVGSYPRPFATVLKTTEVSFPFRIEMNSAGVKNGDDVLRLMYHAARLLPRYAFPVGLDIVDKYAKVPDWLSRNISARAAAVVLNRAMAEGDARVVAQIRQVLSHTPRDFFYRPQA